MSLVRRFLGKLLGRDASEADVVLLPPPPLPHERPRLVTHTVQKAFASPDYRPPLLPAVALELIELFRRPEVGLDEVIPILERDPILASEVVQLAQSPLYATRVPARSIRDAVRRLGLGTVTSLVWESVLRSKVFRCPRYEEAMDRVRLHSLVTAQLARRVGKRCRVDSEQCFLTGLLHDVGVAAALLVLGDQPELDRPELFVVWDGLSEVHEACSGLVTALWGLPEDLQRVVGAHHPTGPGMRGEPPEPVLAVVIVAEHLAASAGAALGPAFDAHEDDIIELALERLRLDPDALIELIEEAGELVSVLESERQAA